MPLGLPQRARSGAGEREVTSRPSATNGQWLTTARSEQTLVFKPLKRRVQGADRVVAPSSPGKIPSDSEAVRLVLQARDRQQSG
jgi:hypothetical protein